MSLDILIDECASAGWLLNLFQIAPDFWEAHLRSADCSAKGRGTGLGPVEAIIAARGTIHDVDLTTNYDGWQSFIRTDPMEGTELLEELGLLKREPVRRI